mgnify:FL=1
MFIMRSIFNVLLYLLIISITGCTKTPELPEMKPTTGVKTSSANALKELNTILEVH